jgi:hypothetical protein
MMNKRSEYQDDPFGPFNLSDFKKWMQNQHDAKYNSSVGLEVESKIPIKKLASRIEVQEGDTVLVIKEFKRNGGIVKEVNGQNFLIENKKGSFLVHKSWIKVKDE